jgi:hypothetical protein
MEIGLLLQYNLYRKKYEKYNKIYYYTSVCIFYIKLNADKITILQIAIQLLI